jgi:hypothetical protein
MESTHFQKYKSRPHRGTALLVFPDFICDPAADPSLSPDRTRRPLWDASLISRNDHHAEFAAILSCVDIFFAASLQRDSNPAQDIGHVFAREILRHIVAGGEKP